MGIKKKLLENKWKLFATVIAIIILIFEVWNFSRWLIKFQFRISTAISIVILMFMFIKILVQYLVEIFKSFQNKKIIKSIMMLLLIIISILVLSIIKNNLYYMTRNIILLLLYIFCVVCTPIIFLGMSILKNRKYKSLRIGFCILALLFIYVIHFPLLISSAKTISNFVINIDNYYPVEDTKSINTQYLETYAQKFVKQGYINKNDVNQIISLTDKKSKQMNIHYVDKMSDINKTVSNKDDEKIKELSEELKAEYYTYSYTKDKDENIDIYISRYIIEEPQIEKTKEKNEDIILKGIKNIDFIENTYKYGTEEFASSFCFTNKVNVQKKKNENILSSFKMLLVYDKENENYIPVVEDEKEYSLIDEYKVYSYGMDIALKDNVKLGSKQYTLRINRYNDNLIIPDKKIIRNNYYYEYEPIVTELTNSKGNIVLEIRFNDNYYRDTLKNIEIIFGEK